MRKFTDVPAHSDSVPAPLRMTDDGAIKPVPHSAVRVDDKFWSRRIDIIRRVTVPTILEKCEETGRLRNFESAASALRGKVVSTDTSPGLPCDDTDVYKAIEAASYLIASSPNPNLDSQLDELIALIAAAQEPDGYLYTARTMAPEAPHSWAGSQRWDQETNLSHELYNLGHLYEAAIAHFCATGKRALLEVALRSAELLLATFGPGKRSIWTGHQIVEMGLIKLSQVTDDKRYLELAQFLLDQRGPDRKPRSGVTYNQSHQRVKDQELAVGHAVRGMYMYAGMADLERLAGVSEYGRALEWIWHDLLSHHMYLTGGIGAYAKNEGFGPPLDLPNLTAFNETCAAIGLVFWSHRMFLLRGHAHAIDVLERSLYNAVLPGVSLDGQSFFYSNPLESFGEYERSGWFACACCPGNLARLLASVAGYQYAHWGSTVYVNLYFAGIATVVLDDGRQITLFQETRYPWDGDVRITLTPPANGELTLKVRIPGWAIGQALPGELYQFSDALSVQPSVSVNGESIEFTLSQGYLTIERTWSAGDQISMSFPMPVRRVIAHPRVAGNVGRIALQRGPLVYAIEGFDQPGHEALNLMIPDAAELSATFNSDLLGGVIEITGTGMRFNRDRTGNGVRKPVKFKAVPYFTWGNRGPNEMSVWIPRDEEHAWIRPAPTMASTSNVRISAGECGRAANDQMDPTCSMDDSHRRTRLEPDADGLTWIEYTFRQSTRVGEVAVYWFKSQDWRSENSPESWRIFYRDDGRWCPVETDDEYGVELDGYQRVPFTPVLTSGLRLEVTPRPNSFVGLLEWQVG